MILPPGSNIISIHLPNLEELLFLAVLALPKASRMGLEERIIPSTPLMLPATSLRYWRTA